MSIKNNVITVSLCLCAGIAIGWTLKPNPSPASVETANNDSQKATRRPTQALSGVAAETAKSRGLRSSSSQDVKEFDIGSEEYNKIEREMSQKMITQLRLKYESHIERVSTQLKLNDAQKAKLTAWLNQLLSPLETSDLSLSEVNMKIIELQKTLSEKTIEDQLLPQLSEDQKVALTDFQEKQHQKKIDTAALKNLSKLQGVVDLDEGQRESVYKAFADAAAAKLAKSAEDNSFDPNAISELLIANDSDPYDLGIQEAIMKSAMNPKADGLKSTDEGFHEKVLEQAIEEKLAPLRPILNEQQLEQYRSELKNKGTGMFGFSFDSETPAKGG